MNPWDQFTTWLSNVGVNGFLLGSAQTAAESPGAYANDPTVETIFPFVGSAESAVSNVGDGISSAAAAASNWAPWIYVLILLIVVLLVIHELKGL